MRGSNWHLKNLSLEIRPKHCSMQLQGFKNEFIVCVLLLPDDIIAWFMERVSVKMNHNSVLIYGSSSSQQL